MSNSYGRQLVIPLTNKSGGGVIAGDVVIIDTTNDGAFTTTTSGAYQGSVGVAQETIANNATGRVLTCGYAALINVPSSMTRGYFIKTHTVAKQATGNATRQAGTFGQFLTGGSTPTGWLWAFPDNAGAAGETVATSTIWDAKGDLVAATGADAATKLTVGANGTILTADSSISNGLAWYVPAGASYKRTSGDYTTSSVTMVDVDGTNLALTITTRAHRVKIGFVGTVSHSGTGQIYLDVAVDGTDQGQTSGPVYGLVGQRITTAAYILNGSFTYLTDVLSAGSHTFKLRWATTGATATIQGGSTSKAYMQFWVEETLLTT